MKIHHIALSTTRLEVMVAFYKKYFGAVEYSTYHNPKTGLKNVFLQFDKGALIEVQTRPGFAYKAPDHSTGYSHLAIHAGDAEDVRFTVERLRADGYTIVSEPRVDGAGYFESTVQDPDGNWIELTAGRVAEAKQAEPPAP